MTAETKIDSLIEEVLNSKIKAAGIAALGGAVGAGLDVYFNGGAHLKDFAKPLAAWGIGGALSGAMSAKEDKDKDNELDKSK